MGTTRDERKCLFCQNSNSLVVDAKIDFDTGWKKYSCPFCGNYSISDLAVTDITFDSNSKNPNIYFQLAALANERRLQGRSNLYLGSQANCPEDGFTDYKDFLHEFPQDFRQQYDRALLNFARVVNYSPLRSLPFKEINYPQLFFCNSAPESKKLLDIFKQDGLISFYENKDQFGHFLLDFALTSKGFDYVRKIEADSSRQQLAFVAMWFHNEMDNYREAVEKAIRLAGYEPYIANRDSYNGLIMAKVMNKIAESRFVIADLTSLPEQDNSTGVRGGVYFEAGYAAGLKKEVILTCRSDVTERIHFDLKQFFSIYWHQTDDNKLKAWDFDFVEYLANHIIKSVGVGPLKVTADNNRGDSEA